MASIPARVFAQGLSLFSKACLGASRPLPLQRHGFSLLMSIIPPPRGVKYEPVDAGGVPAAWLIPDNSDSKKVLVYFHGGGYVIGTIRTYRQFAGRIAKGAGCRALLVDYRLAPENMFPAALEDAVCAYKWLLDKGYEPQNIIFAGESAGGGLSMATVIEARDENLPMPAAEILLSPWTDLTFSSESVRNNMNQDPMMACGKEEITGFIDMYLGNTDPKNPLASPLYADMERVPPMMLQVGSNEILLDDATNLNEKATQAGTEVDFSIWDEMYHGFQLLSPLVPESNKALKSIVGFCKNKMAV